MRFVPARSFGNRRASRSGFLAVIIIGVSGDTGAQWPRDEPGGFGRVRPGDR